MHCRYLPNSIFFTEYILKDRIDRQKVNFVENAWWGMCYICVLDLEKKSLIIHYILDMFCIKNSIF